MKFKKEKQWNVLLVQDTGKTVLMSLRTCILLIGLLIILTAASTAGVMKLLPKGVFNTGNTTSLPLSGSPEINSKTSASPDSEKQAEMAASGSTAEPSDGKKQKTDNKKASQPVNASKTKTTTAKAEKKNPTAAPTTMVSVQDASTSYNKSNQVLTFQFKLKNQMDSPASGHAVVILKKNPDRRKTWITLPDNVPLIKGKPDGKTEGNEFSISNYKIMRFSAKKQRHPKRFNIATIFIFDKSGKLIIEKDHPITID